nr:DUF6537 domain-containing protein [Achromobacter sp. DMS1]
MAGVQRQIEFQDPAYAEEYLRRVKALRDLDERHGGEAGQWALTEAAARYVATAMAYDDVIRVADLKTRGSRFERVRGEVGAQPGQLVYTTEFVHPRLEEICGTLPAGLGRWLEGSRTFGGFVQRRLAKGRRLQSGTLGGFLMLYALAGMRRLRRRTLRHQAEMASLKQWLDLVARLAPQDYALAVETLKCRRLVKGYSDTHARGGAMFRVLLDAAEGWSVPMRRPRCANSAKPPWRTRNAARWNGWPPRSWRPRNWPPEPTQNPSGRDDAVHTLKLIVREVRQESPSSARCGWRAKTRPPAGLRPGRPRQGGRARPGRAALLFAGAARPRCGALRRPAGIPAGRAAGRPQRGRLGATCTGCRPGDAISVEGPHNDFPLHEAPSGEEPVLPHRGRHRHHAGGFDGRRAQGAGRAFHLHYCGRSAGQLAFLPELQVLAARGHDGARGRRPRHLFRPGRAAGRAPRRANTSTSAAPRA